LGCLVDYHGGAFIFGSAKMDHPANVRYSSQLGIVVVSVDYRLAPEDPFPAGVEDCRPASRSAEGALEGRSPLPSR
jgi:acetyl esterase